MLAVLFVLIVVVVVVVVFIIDAAFLVLSIVYNMFSPLYVSFLFVRLTFFLFSSYATSVVHILCLFHLLIFLMCLFCCCYCCWCSCWFFCHVSGVVEVVVRICAVILF